MSRHVPARNLAKLLRVLRFAVAAWMAALLVACGGPAEPTGPSAPTPASPTSIASSSSPSTQGETPGETQREAQYTALEQAVLAYLGSSLSTPYREVRVQVVSEDDAFATVEVHAQLRPTEEADWENHVATYKLKKVGAEGAEWHVDEAESFVSVLAPQRTATAEAERIRQLTINDMDILSAASGWAVASNLQAGYDRGTGSTVLRLVSGRWEQVEHFDNFFLSSIAMLDDETGFAVGYKVTGQGGQTSLILRISNGTFEEMSHPTLRRLEAVELVETVSELEAWAVGAGESERSEDGILHFINGSWVESPVLEAPDGYNRDLQLRSLSLLPDGSGGIAVGGDTILELHAGTWARTLYKDPRNDWSYILPAAGMELRSVYMLPTGEAFAVGGRRPNDTYTLAILHLPGPEPSEGEGAGEGMEEGEPERWQVIVGPEGMLATARDVFAVSGDDVWIVGDKRGDADINKLENAIWRLQNRALHDVEHPDTGGYLSAIQVLPTGTGSELEAWAAGYGGLTRSMLHLEDGKWNLYSP